MFSLTAFKLFMASPLGSLVKWALVVFAVIGFLYGVYATGKSAGHTAGYTEGVASQQPEIKALTKIINDERIAIADKTKGVEKDASDGVIAAQKVGAKKEKQRSDIVNNYKKNKVAKIVCVLPVSAVKAINEMLETQIVYPNMSEVEETEPVVPIPPPSPKLLTESDNLLQVAHYEN